MDTRSRLRSQDVRRRRLFFLVLLLVVSVTAALWYTARTRPHLWEQTRLLLGFTEYTTAVSQDRVRGTIYDRNYKEYAVTYERVSVYANIREIAVLAEALRPLAEIIGISENDLYERVEEGSLRTWLAKDISQAQEEKIRELDLPGIHLHREYVRYYPQQESAAHLIGFVERDSGLSGIEHYLNRLETSHRLEKGAVKDLPQVRNGSPGADGRHLVLTLDLKIQQILDRYLKNFSDAAPGIKVGALVMEAGSGSLVGYAQVPSFDPNRFHTYPEELFTDVFNETIAVPDQFKIFLRDVSLLESQSGKGLMSEPWSVAAEKRKLGIQLQLWDKLGAGSRAKPDFTSSQPARSDRVAHDSPATSRTDFETVPVMQTPLQLLTAITRIINGATSVTPHAADRFVLRRNQKEFLLKDLNPPLKKGVLQDGVSREARELFRVQAQPGPLRSALLEDKSTSYRMNGGMSSFLRHDVFMALVPIRDPELVIMVVMSSPGYLTEPEGDSMLTNEALEIIAPVVALQRVMKNLADMMSPGDKEEMNFSSTPSSGSLDENLNTDGAGQQPRSDIKMPLLTDMSLRKSLRLLQSASVDVEVRGTGRVVDQEPAAGAPLDSVKRVILILERDQVDADFKQSSDMKSE
jgi:cell division protein FtsI (penicillin-binding protein 3)